MRSIYELRGTSRKLANILQEILETSYATILQDSNINVAEEREQLRRALAAMQQTTGVIFDPTFLDE